MEAQGYEALNELYVSQNLRGGGFIWEDPLPFSLP
jgi:hypothetical protein